MSFHVLSNANLRKGIQKFTEINIKMNTIFMNSENNRTSDVHRLRFNLTDKIDLQRADDHVALSNLTTQ